MQRINPIKRSVNQPNLENQRSIFSVICAGRTCCLMHNCADPSDRMLTAFCNTFIKKRLEPFRSALDCLFIVALSRHLTEPT